MLSADLRARAAELRKRAKEVSDYALRRDLLYIAEQYEIEARIIDRDDARDVDRAFNMSRSKRLA